MSKKRLRILHTNDLHSQLENWPSVTAWLKRRRSEAIANGESVLLFDIGDHADRVHPMTEGLMGKGNVILLNEMKYDAITIGNNEGITFSRDDLNSMYENKNFPVVVCNLFDESGSIPPWAVPYEILTTDNGIRVGITGATVPFKMFYKTLGWDIKDPFDLLKEVVDKLKPEVDILICLSHLGLFEDERLAEEIPCFDYILGAHTHHVLHEGKKINNTWINQAGRSGKYAGEIALTLTETNGKLSLNTEYVESVLLDLLEKDKETEDTIKKLTQKGERELSSSEVVYLNDPMEVSWYNSTPLIELLAQGLREWCEADIGMVNAGVLLDNLPTGKVTFKDVHRICPHPINPAAVMISGEGLLEIIRQAQKKEMVEFPLKGFGFRGKILGEMIFSGLDISNNASYIQDKDVFIHGESLDKNRSYKLATVDMFTLGKIYPAISSIKEKTYFMPEMLRDILAWKLRNLVT
ncbi:2',3'-cyclic-nucleotide 2'-phosphodiesterase (5'-nucleotidase family) [Evansella vedderi]|uniref:2',3'-cyclic-nucleotide 2'-phosphodiesterase (5'-nucleotidase family) n=1 Tax=Evansella vedderi TaxID=38282 RepID=A0ABU0A3P1_9BACI|nr:bifunctional UDP-sugar hydrolase/5'-nucleotidase [Evansella vedderi]MDQ0257622.1 2',3'-cyclic-nucleotide 2'-phosphodiesterase (5'-nucleotidase family) [Evansella vedderi]